MELKDQVTSLELSKRLKELGVKQHSLCYWRLAYHVTESFNAGIRVNREGIFGDYRLEYLPKPRYSTANVKWNERDLAKLDETELSAFTGAELGEMLPLGHYTFQDEENFWYATRHRQKNELEEDVLIETADTEADARAKTLIYLIENNLIALHTSDSNKNI